MKPIIFTLLAALLAIMLAPPQACGAYGYSYVDYVDRDNLTVDVGGYSCTYQPYQDTGIEVYGELYGEYYGMFDSAWYGRWWYTWSYSACVDLMGSELPRGQWYSVYGDHYYYWDLGYPREWLDYSEDWVFAPVVELVPWGEESYPDNGLWFYDPLAKNFYAVLYPNSEQYDWHRVWESVSGLTDTCQSIYGGGPPMSVQAGGEWFVGDGTSSGNYGPDQVGASREWAVFYSNAINQSPQHTPCGFFAFQTMYYDGAWNLGVPYAWNSLGQRLDGSTVTSFRANAEDSTGI